MINSEDRTVLHEFIKLDMAIRSLQQDYASLEKLKMSEVYINIVANLLKDIRNDFHKQRRFLTKKNIAVVKWVKIDQYFSDVVIRTAGEDEVLRYAQSVLKSQVEELINSYLSR
ncbi:aconitate hydratase [Lysinibacillus sp. NPDC098008]|uniref:aconitate hydratase n=2 Tax=unclassified Lysinibacillus TaxID=2636778 RepID=UPI0038103AFE